MENDNLKLKQYLLGSLTAPEIEAIDLQIIEDASLEEKLDCAESELLEDFLDDALSPSEVTLFQANFLVTRERETHLRQILLLKNYARSATTQNACGEEPEKSPKGFLAALKEFFSLRLHLAAVALLLVVLGSTVGIILYSQAGEPTALEMEFTRLNQENLDNPAAFGDLTNINLISGAYRSLENGAKKLPDGKLTERVFFRLDLPVEANTNERFNAQIVKDDEIIFTQNKMRLYKNPSGQELRFFLPSSILKKGEYQIKINKEDGRHSAVIYNFAVQ